MMRITVLGSGHSGGTPLVGVGWGKCDPDNPKNLRLRPSILVESDDSRLLIDTSPDLRQQLLNSGVLHIDGLVYTHDHADHLHGLDDLRALNRAMNADIPAFASAETWAVIEARFGYVLEPLKEDVGYYYKPCLERHDIAAGETFTAAGFGILAIDQDHGFIRTLGFRIGDFAYCTDVVEMPANSINALKGVKTWMVGVLMDDPHPTHVHVDKAIDWAREIGAERTIMIHLSQHLDFDTLAARLPDGMEPAYDGMVVTV